MGRLQVKVVSDFEDIEDYQSAWDEFLPKASYQTIFQTFEWHEYWLQCFGDEIELLFLFALDGSELVGIAPLCIHSKRVNGLKERILTFVGASNLSSDYVDFIVAKDREDVLELFLLTIRQHSKLWTLFSWPNMPGFSLNRLRTEEYFKLRQCFVRTTFLYDAPTWLRTDPSEDQEVLGKKSVKRKEKAFEKLGTVEFSHVRETGEALSLLDVLIEQHINRWSNTKYPSLFNEEKQVAFFKLLVEGLLEKGWVQFSCLSLNGKPAALHFGFQYSGVYLWYKPSFDESLAEHSPGQVLLKYLLEYVSKESLKEFDFGCGSEFFKYRFSNHVRKIYRLDIYRRRVSMWAAQARSLVRKLRKKEK